MLQWNAERERERERETDRNGECREIDWLINVVFYTVSAIFRPYNGGKNVECEKEENGSVLRKIYTLQ